MKNKANYNKAFAEAKKVLQENYVVEPPVKIDDIVQNYGIRVFETEFSDPNVAGFFKLETKMIYINKNDSLNRQTFTVAHELGHYLMHEKEIREDPSKYSIVYRKPIGQMNDDPIEAEANCFAANLLVPKDFLLEYQHLSISNLAKVFLVSEDVIGYRMKNIVYGSN